MKIKVPASSANLGCGFDSVGLAVNLYIEAEVLEQSGKWEVIHSFGRDIPRDSTNLIISTALKIAPDLPPHKIRVTSDIPLERGLGSSSSALIAGIELACVIGGMNLSTQVKLQLACSLEGHPDNVVPALLGGLVVSTYCEGILEYVKADAPEFGLVAYVPDYKLSTTAMRKILPQDISFKDAVHASAIGNTMVASLLRGDMAKAGRMIENDLLHEKYRLKLVPELEDVREVGREYGAYATYLSGAGSAIMCITPRDKSDALAVALGELPGNADVLKLSLDTEGTKRV
jgi:homoserine kinase